MPPGAAKGTLPFDLTVSDPLSRVQAYIEKYQDDPQYAVGLTREECDMSYTNVCAQGFEAVLMRSIRVMSAKRTAAEDGMEASVSFELTVPPGLCNPMDRMHGGAMATLADMSTTMATAYDS
jgi:hypothetical protein